MSSSSGLSSSLSVVSPVLVFIVNSLMVAPLAHCGSAQQVVSLHSTPGCENPSPSFARSSPHRRARARLLVVPIVLEDLTMIERQRRQFVERIDANILCVVGGARRARRPAEIHERDRRAARVALGIGVGEKLVVE